MSATCPHCTKELGSGFLTQEQHVDRLKGPAKARDEALAEAERAKSEVETVRAQTAAQLKIANEKVEAASAASVKALADMARASAERDRFQALAADGITKPAKVKGFSLAYDAYQAEAGDKAKPFAEWLAADARADEFLAQHFAKPADPDAGKGAADEAAAKADAGKAADTAKAAAPAGKALPPANAGAGTPPAGSGKLTAQQGAEVYNQGVDAIMKKGLPRAERQKEIAALKETVTAQVAT